jgi:hypothetical protein
MRHYYLLELRISLSRFGEHQQRLPARTCVEDVWCCTGFTKLSRVALCLLRRRRHVPVPAARFRALTVAICPGTLSSTCLEDDRLYWPSSPLLRCACHLHLHFLSKDCYLGPGAFRQRETKRFFAMSIVHATTRDASAWMLLLQFSY